MPHTQSTILRHRPTNQTTTIGCVSYLNARPLIHNLDKTPQLRILPAVPSQLLAQLESRQVDVALCPVVDYDRCATALQIVPAGAIGCDGPALTVRLFSKTPFDQVDSIHADTDSHTSVVLAQIVLAKTYHRAPTIQPLSKTKGHRDSTPQTMLLIGDKVITNRPARTDYPHQLDLGLAWKQLTNLPFVFAVWMARQDSDPAPITAILDQQRRSNAALLTQIADHYSPQYNWPPALARKYLTRLMKYDLGPNQLEAINHFTRLAEELGVLKHPRPLPPLSDGASEKPPDGLGQAPF